MYTCECPAHLTGVFCEIGACNNFLAIGSLDGIKLSTRYTRETEATKLFISDPAAIDAIFSPVAAAIAAAEPGEVAGKGEAVGEVLEEAGESDVPTPEGGRSQHGAEEDVCTHTDYPSLYPTTAERDRVDAENELRGDMGKGCSKPRNPCLHAGACTPEPANCTFTCVCTGGFVGETCSIPVRPVRKVAVERKLQGTQLHYTNVSFFVSPFSISGSMADDQLSAPVEVTMKYCTHDTDGGDLHALVWDSKSLVWRDWGQSCPSDQAQSTSETVPFKTPSLSSSAVVALPEESGGAGPLADKERILDCVFKGAKNPCKNGGACGATLIEVAQDVGEDIIEVEENIGEGAVGEAAAGEAPDDAVGEVSEAAGESDVYTEIDYSVYEATCTCGEGFLGLFCEREPICSEHKFQLCNPHTLGATVKPKIETWISICSGTLCKRHRKPIDAATVGLNERERRTVDPEVPEGGGDDAVVPELVYIDDASQAALFLVGEASNTKPAVFSTVYNCEGVLLDNPPTAPPLVTELPFDDVEGDAVIFELQPFDEKPLAGYAEVTEDGVLSFYPSPFFYGVTRLKYRVTETTESLSGLPEHAPETSEWGSITIVVEKPTEEPAPVMSMLSGLTKEFEFPQSSELTQEDLIFNPAIMSSTTQYFAGREKRKFKDSEPPHTSTTASIYGYIVDFGGAGREGTMKIHTFELERQSVGEDVLFNAGDRDERLEQVPWDEQAQVQSHAGFHEEYYLVPSHPAYVAHKYLLARRDVEAGCSAKDVETNGLRDCPYPWKALSTSLNNSIYVEIDVSAHGFALEFLGSRLGDSFKYTVTAESTVPDDGGGRQRRSALGNKFLASDAYMYVTVCGEHERLVNSGDKGVPPLNQCQAHEECDGAGETHWIPRRPTLYKDAECALYSVLPADCTAKPQGAWISIEGTKYQDFVCTNHTVCDRNREVVEIPGGVFSDVKCQDSSTMTTATSTAPTMPAVGATPGAPDKPDENKTETESTCLEDSTKEGCTASTEIPWVEIAAGLAAFFIVLIVLGIVYWQCKKAIKHAWDDDDDEERMPTPLLFDLFTHMHIHASTSNAKTEALFKKYGHHPGLFVVRRDGLDRDSEKFVLSLQQPIPKEVIAARKKAKEAKLLVDNNIKETSMDAAAAAAAAHAKEAARGAGAVIEMTPADSSSTAGAFVSGLDSFPVDTTADTGRADHAFVLHVHVVRNADGSFRLDAPDTDGYEPTKFDDVKDWVAVFDAINEGRTHIHNTVTMFIPRTEISMIAETAFDFSVGMNTAIHKSANTWKKKTEENIERRRQESEERERKLAAAFNLITTFKRLHGQANARIAAKNATAASAAAYASECASLAKAQNDTKLALEAKRAADEAKRVAEEAKRAAYERNSLWDDEHAHLNDLAVVADLSQIKKPRRKKRNVSMQDGLKLALATYSTATRHERAKLEKQFARSADKVRTVQVAEDAGNANGTLLLKGKSKFTGKVAPALPPALPTRVPSHQKPQLPSEIKKNDAACADDGPASSEGFRILRQLSTTEAADSDGGDAPNAAVGLGCADDMDDPFALLTGVTEVKMLDRTLVRPTFRGPSPRRLSAHLSETSFGSAARAAAVVPPSSKNTAETSFDCTSSAVHDDIEEVDLDAQLPINIAETSFDYTSSAVHDDMEEVDLDTQLPIKKVSGKSKKSKKSMESLNVVSLALVCTLSACILGVVTPVGADAAAPPAAHPNVPTDYPELYEATAKIGQLTYSRFGGDLRALMKWYDLDDSDKLEIENKDNENEFTSMFAHAGVGSSITREHWAKGFVRSFDTGGDCDTDVPDSKIHINEVIKGFKRLGLQLDNGNADPWTAFRPQVSHSKGWVAQLIEPKEYDDWLCTTADDDKNARRWPNLADIEKATLPAIDNHNKKVASFDECNSEAFSMCMQDPDMGMCELCYLQTGCRVMNRLTHVSGNKIHGSRLIVARDFVENVEKIEEAAAMCSASIFVVTGFHRERGLNAEPSFKNTDQEHAQLTGHSVQFYLEYLGGLCDSDCFANADTLPPQATCFVEKITKIVKVEMTLETATRKGKLMVWDPHGKGFGGTRNIPTIYWKGKVSYYPKGGAVCNKLSKLSAEEGNSHCCDKDAKVVRAGTQNMHNKCFAKSDSADDEASCQAVLEAVACRKVKTVTKLDDETELACMWQPEPWCTGDRTAMDTKGPGTLAERYAGVDVPTQRAQARADAERAHDFGCMNTVTVEHQFSAAVHDSKGANRDSAGELTRELKTVYKEWCLSQLADAEWCAAKIPAESDPSYPAVTPSAMCVEKKVGGESNEVDGNACSAAAEQGVCESVGTTAAPAVKVCVWRPPGSKLYKDWCLTQLADAGLCSTKFPDAASYPAVTTDDKCVEAAVGSDSVNADAAACAAIATQEACAGRQSATDSASNACVWQPKGSPLVLQVLETDAEASPTAFPQAEVAKTFPELEVPSYTETQFIQEDLNGVANFEYGVKTAVLSSPLIDATMYRPQTFIAPQIQVGHFLSNFVGFNTNLEMHDETKMHHGAGNTGVPFLDSATPEIIQRCDGLQAALDAAHDACYKSFLACRTCASSEDFECDLSAFSCKYPYFRAHPALVAGLSAVFADFAVPLEFARAFETKSENKFIDRHIAKAEDGSPEYVWPEQRYRAGTAVRLRPKGLHSTAMYLDLAQSIIQFCYKPFQEAGVSLGLGLYADGVHVDLRFSEGLPFTAWAAADAIMPEHEFEAWARVEFLSRRNFIRQRGPSPGLGKIKKGGTVCNAQSNLDPPFCCDETYKVVRPGQQDVDDAVNSWCTDSAHPDGTELCPIPHDIPHRQSKHFAPALPSPGAPGVREGAEGFCALSAKARSNHFEAAWGRLSPMYDMLDPADIKDKDVVKQHLEYCIKSCDATPPAADATEASIARKKFDSCDAALHWLPIKMMGILGTCHLASRSSTLKTEACFWGMCVEDTPLYKMLDPAPTFRRKLEQKSPIDPVEGDPEALFGVLNPHPVPVLIQRLMAAECGGVVTVWLGSATDFSAMLSSIRILLAFNQHVSLVEFRVEPDAKRAIVLALANLVKELKSASCRQYGRDVLTPTTVVGGADERIQDPSF